MLRGVLFAAFETGDICAQEHTAALLVLKPPGSVAAFARRPSDIKMPTVWRGSMCRLSKRATDGSSERQPENHAMC
jgi:hypothetical protein